MQVGANSISRCEKCELVQKVLAGRRVQTGMNDASGHEGCKDTSGHGGLGLLPLF